MVPYLTRHYGNPSSAHRLGQEARRAVESARHTVADLLGASPAEITFTGGATESDNIAIAGSIRGLGIRHAISSSLEHKAVLQPLTRHSPEEGVRLHWLSLDAQGRPDYDHLDRLRQHHRTDGLPTTLVSLMQGNNEIGNLNDIERIGWLCRQQNALFHSDTVQTVGRDWLVNRDHIGALKEWLINRLREVQPLVQFNGTSSLPDESMHTVLSVSLLPLPSGESLIQALDGAGIAVSGGSACSNLTPFGLARRGLAGSGSHVLSAIGPHCKYLRQPL